ncbi:MAG: single-stranded DNA-binding protein [Candidatus Kerfeldbacteria bacterium]|nr:single-stranded DNA-binding protein [Candidatus Kerfeldbacteria bacterium]
MDLNKVMLIGRLTRDPEMRTIPSGENVATFSIATGRQWTDKSSGEKKSVTEFHNVVAWRRLADICGQYLKKGRQVYIEGRLQTRSWDDPSGNKRYRTEIVAENLIMLGSKDGGGSTASPAMDTSMPQTPPPPAGNDEETISIEDIPF